ncbi:MAG: HAMP domain-containing histidine kinase [Mycobacteriaceae bacterium]|nr:HAMP domain-containing histidine kinase [Mycobacteriaceae bacterium]
MSLRGRIALLAASVVAITVAVVAAAAYVVVARTLYAEVDNQLLAKAGAITQDNPYGFDLLSSELSATFLSEDMSFAVIPPGVEQPYQPIGSAIPIGADDWAVAHGLRRSALHTVNNQRVFTTRTPSGWTLVVAQKLTSTNAVLNRLSWVLFVVGGGGVALAAVAGTAVGRTGLRPIGRLTAAFERVARTDDLTPIPVTGHDELARLTESFNAMLLALAESRERQTRLVADAGHELRTPLTSLRTNMELLIASSRPGAPQLPETDMAELRSDVMAQIEELSTLVGDLVDLAREEAPETVFEPIDLGDVVERALERVRRRRATVEFVATLQPWFIYGHEAGLQRAVLNVLDNAAKWSPDGAQVLVAMREIPGAATPGHASGGLLELTVDDAGPGIPEDERELVFERFYRTMSARAMPGSGLGLAIVRQVVVKHGGTIAIDASDRGGALIRVVLPGESGAAAADEDNLRDEP